MVEWGGLENRCPACAGPGVRIPLSPLYQLLAMQLQESGRFYIHFLMQTGFFRPDQSDGVMTVPKKMFQVKEGVLMTKVTFVNNLTLRYGITNSTEIRVLLDCGLEVESHGLQPPFGLQASWQPCWHQWRQFILSERGFPGGFQNLSDGRK